MTAQHLGQFQDVEANNGHHFQENSRLLPIGDGINYQENSHPLVHRGVIILVCLVVVGFLSRGLIKQHQQQRTNTNSSQTIKFSLWMIPPPSVSDVLEEQISFYSKTSGGPYFDPHVTVTGGIECDSFDDAKKIVSLLQQELSGFGKVDAVFQTKARNFDTWNQALLVEMDASPKFVKLCQRVRELLKMDTTNLFSPPVNAPHLSLFYGVNNVPNANDVETIPNFTSNTLALYITDPATAEGVPEWEFFAEISLA
ncbi:unnamed protein product [Cylindrotheca closterium]|uniref:2',3'-cyclic-nucleotide 3'-phosphodiesterase n=1 Tax=Cylindrotheca closterium TaxID=2856 RepID=A0AAD2FCC5_9STRA|nr:unnamed protein product [Cylindrotheca closterium]